MGIEDRLPEPRFATIDKKRLDEATARAKANPLRIIRVYTAKEMDEIYEERSRAVYAVKLEQKVTSEKYQS